MNETEKLAAEKAARDARNAEFATYVRKVCTDSGLANLAENLTAEQLVESLRSEVVRLRPLADDATKLRGSLIDACVTEGKRALGDKYKEETQRAMLAKLPVEDIETMRDAFKEQADAAIPTGRKSGELEDADETDQTTTRSALPESAFASA